MKSLLTLTLAAVLSVSGANLAIANDAHHPSANAPLADASAAQSAADTSAVMSEGEIRKVDKEAGKVTIRHGELKNLEMPPMTMVFRVKDKAMLEQVKPGDKVNFVAEKVDNKLTIMQLQPAATQ